MMGARSGKDRSVARDGGRPELTAAMYVDTPHPSPITHHPSPSSPLTLLHRYGALRCFVPALVEERVEAGQQDQWLSESRKLVTVFMKVVGLGERLCEVRSLSALHSAVSEVQATTHRYGGQVTYDPHPHPQVTRLTLTLTLTLTLR